MCNNRHAPELTAASFRPASLNQTPTQVMGGVKQPTPHAGGAGATTNGHSLGTAQFITVHTKGRQNSFSIGTPTH
jgi:hypothetical protein